MGAWREGKNGVEDRDPRRLRNIFYALSRGRYPAVSAFRRLRANELHHYRRYARRRQRSCGLSWIADDVVAAGAESGDLYRGQKPAHAIYGPDGDRGRPPTTGQDTAFHQLRS